MTGEVIMFVGVPAGLLAGVCTLAFSRLLPRRVIIPNDGHPAMQKARLLETAEEVGLRNRSASIAKLGSGFEVAAALVATATPVVFLATAINHFHPWPFTYGAMALSTSLWATGFLIRARADKLQLLGNATVLQDKDVQNLITNVTADVDKHSY